MNVKCLLSPLLIGVLSPVCGLSPEIDVSGAFLLRVAATQLARQTRRKCLVGVVGDVSMNKLYFIVYFLGLEQIVNKSLHLYSLVPPTTPVECVPPPEF